MIGNHSSSARGYLSFYVFEFCFAVPSLQGNGIDQVDYCLFKELLNFIYFLFFFLSDSICDESSVGRSIYGSLECGGVNVAIR